MWALALLLASASPSPGPVNQSDSAIVVPDRQIAVKLVETLYPKAEIKAFTTRAAIDSLSTGFSTEPQLKKLEINYPGLRGALFKRAPDVLDSIFEDRLPALYSAMIDQLLAAMSLQELGDALAFAEGPEGQALQQVDTDFVIKNYLEKGRPLRPSELKKRGKDLKTPAVKDPRAAQWAKANMLIGPALRTWTDEQKELQSQKLVELMAAIMSEMVDREPT